MKIVYEVYRYTPNGVQNDCAAYKLTPSAFMQLSRLPSKGELSDLFGLSAFLIQTYMVNDTVYIHYNGNPFGEIRKVVCKVKKVLGLCGGRHDIPVIEDYIFPSGFFKDDCSMFDWERSKRQTNRVLQGVEELDLYVTGLTPALTVVMDWCFKNQVKLTLYHYDRVNCRYVRQDTHCDCFTR